MPTTLTEKLNDLPRKPGCYLFKGADGSIIYVGKAISLRNRVRSYFQAGANHTLRIRRLVERVVDLDTIVVGSELEALVLECNLIKRYQPHFNVRLRDDKHYPYLCLTTSDPFPRLLLTRKVRADGNRYFGPYSSSRPVYATMDLIKKIFPLVSCGKRFTGDNVQRPCLYYHMGQCLAPCAGIADREVYQEAVRDVVAFLEGKQDILVRDLRRQMMQASENMQFERAAKIRDQVRAVEEVMLRQKVISTQLIDQDVIAVVAEEGGAMVQMFYIRGGKLIGQNHFLLEGTDTAVAPPLEVRNDERQPLPSPLLDKERELGLSEDSALEKTGHEGYTVPPPYQGGGQGEVSPFVEADAIPPAYREGTQGGIIRQSVQEFVKQYYQSAAYIPQEVLLPCDIDEVNIVQQWLRQKKGSKVEISVPVRGDKRKLVEMATENASHAFDQMKAEMRAKLGNTERALMELADALDLDTPPERIECYDISNQGSDFFVGSMVVCERGQMNKNEYRRFKIKNHEGRPDDFAMIREVLSRRLEEGKAGNPKFSKMPDLIIVDGGKGQLSAAIMALHGAGFKPGGFSGLTGNSRSGMQEGKRTAEVSQFAEIQDYIADSQTISPTDSPSPTTWERGPGGEGSVDNNIIPVVGLAKRFENLIVPHREIPVILPRTSQALYLVQRIRDEAHRFANAYRVTLQAKRQTRSVLDDIPGVGPKRRLAMLREFGSVDMIRQKTVDELASIQGMDRRAAEAVAGFFAQVEAVES
jgi:excinuclease ABC subunit C